MSDGRGVAQNDLRLVARKFRRNGKRRAANLEDVYWNSLRAMAAVQDTDLNMLVTGIVEQHPDTCMSRVLRAAVTLWWRDQALAASMQLVTTRS